MSNEFIVLTILMSLLIPFSFSFDSEDFLNDAFATASTETAVDNSLLVLKLTTEKITSEQVESVNTIDFEVLKYSDTTITVLAKMGRDFLQKISPDSMGSIEVINNPDNILELTNKSASRAILVEFKDASKFWETVSF